MEFQGKLSEREQKIMDMALTGATLEKIGAEIGVTRERIRQLIAKITMISGVDIQTLQRAARQEPCPQCDHLGTLHTAWKSFGPACAQCNQTEREERKKRWHKQWGFCVACKGTEFLHYAHGVCKKCYTMWLYNNNPERRKSIKMLGCAWRKKHPEVIKERNRKAYQARKLKG